MKIFNIYEFIDKIKKDCNSPDLNIKIINNKKDIIATIYFESITSTSDVNYRVIEGISTDIRYNIKYKNLFNYIYNSINSTSLKILEDYQEILNYLYNGFVIIAINNEKKVIACEARATLDRGIMTPTTEAIVRGPKDGFTEKVNKNLGLIRRRIKTNNLKVIEKNVGRLTKTRICLCFMDNICDNNLINSIIEKIDEIDIDSIIDSGYLRELIINDNNSSFPTIMSTERPDNACMSLLDGKVVILIDNTPFSLIIPTFFSDYFHTPEDYYQKSINVSFIRIIRFLAFFISILTPAIYIALVTYNQKNIPTTFLFNFINQRVGVPFPSFIEAFIMMIAFEILKESDIRLPSIGGSSVSILGGIIIGDAAVSAGIVSPIMVVVISITAISSLVFSSVDMVSAIRNYRILFLFSSALLGIYGIILMSLFLIVKLTSLETFNIPFMYPFAPFNFKEQKDTIIRESRNKLEFRNFLTARKNIRRMKRNWLQYEKEIILFFNVINTNIKWM